MSGRKNFVAGEILTASDVNSFLMDQSVMVFDDGTARTSAIPSPIEGMVTYRKDEKAVEVFDGSAFGPIGKILQVVSTTKTNTFTTSSTSYTNVTGLSVSLTPSSTANKVLLMATINLGGIDSFNAGVLARFGGGNASVVGDAAQSRGRVFVGFISSSSANRTANKFQMFTGTPVLLDSPSTTSPITYSVQICSNAGSPVYLNRAREDANDSGTMRGVSTITAMEVAG